jgi:formamidopyrimidine-DNA glycosylase
VLCIHLGMSGQLRFVPHGQTLDQADHVHAVWNVQCKKSSGTLIFRDPRRFGGIWAFDSIDALREHRWNALGPDALTITGELLHAQLSGRHRPIKSALLDQAVLAGVGNIYADEALFAAGIHPATKAHRIDAQRADTLAASIVEILSSAIASGGSTIRSYVDSTGQGGSFAQFHRVYGRAGQPCLQCEAVLAQSTIAQRTTVHCPKCQSLRPTPRSRHKPGRTHLSTSRTHVIGGSSRGRATKSELRATGGLY